MQKKKLLVFNSGSGSGFENLVHYSRGGKASFSVVGVVVDREDRLCIQRAIRLGIDYRILKSYTAQDYQEMIKYFNPDHVQGSGWLKPFVGVDPRTTSNIHPGLLPRFGGKGMYGHHVHQATIIAYLAGEIKYSAVSMHFVTERYDEGPKFLEYVVDILSDDTADTLGSRVNAYEHMLQPYVTDLLLRGEISWDGKDVQSLKINKELLNPGIFKQLVANPG